uniref:Uncharacterized protein n=1 Tax=Solanum tuberosum TaxID=4113 RepID=M1C276_SOLTU
MEACKFFSYLKREECKYYRKALRLLHGKPLLNFDCISLWEWKQHKLFKKLTGSKLTGKHKKFPISLCFVLSFRIREDSAHYKRFTSNLDKVNNKCYLEPASL